MWIGVKRQLAVATVDCDTVGVLCKMKHICAIGKHADMPYVYGFCDGRATADVEGEIIKIVLN